MSKMPAAVPGVTQMQFADLQLQPGQALQLELEGYQEEQRYRCTLVGYRLPHSITVTAPNNNGLTVNGLQDMTVKARLFSSHLNGACAFEAKVLHLVRKPYPYLHLSIPEMIYLGEVRKTVRADVSIIASVFYTDGDKTERATARLIDLSAEGARISTDTLPVNNGDEITLVKKLKVSGVERILKVKAIVRSINISHGKPLFGLQFIELSEQDRVMIHASVLSHLYNVPNG